MTPFGQNSELHDWFVHWKRDDPLSLWVAILLPWVFAVVSIAVPATLSSAFPFSDAKQALALPPKVGAVTTRITCKLPSGTFLFGYELVVVTEREKRLVHHRRERPHSTSARRRASPSTAPARPASPACPTAARITSSARCISARTRACPGRPSSWTPTGTPSAANSAEHVEIGEHVWVAPNVQSSKGARIGAHSHRRHERGRAARRVPGARAAGGHTGQDPEDGHPRLVVGMGGPRAERAAKASADEGKSKGRSG